MQRFFQILSVLGVNAVPAAGWFFEGWNAGTTLALYWFENVAATLFIAARILVHRRLVPSRGHFEHNARASAGRGSRGTFLSGFLLIALTFSAAHGFFLAILTFLMTHNGRGAEIGLDWVSIGRGCGGVLAFLFAGFVMDLPGLRKKTFFWIEQMAERHLGRVFIVHLSLIFGMLAVALTNASKAFFSVFVGFKTLNDLATALPQWNPDEPPRWLCRLMDKVPNTSGKARAGETFADFWKRDKTEEIARRNENEKPFRRG